MLVTLSGASQALQDRGSQQHTAHRADVVRLMLWATTAPLTCADFLFSFSPPCKHGAEVDVSVPVQQRLIEASDAHEVDSKACVMLL